MLLGRLVPQRHNQSLVINYGLPFCVSQRWCWRKFGNLVGLQYSRGGDPRVEQRLGALAVLVGFQTEEAKDLAAQDGEYRLAARLVNRADIGDTIAEEATQQIANILRSAQEQPSESVALGESSRATFAGEKWLPPERRCDSVITAYILQLLCR